MSEQSHQVNPSAGVLAHDLENQLRTIYDALASLEGNLKQQHRGPTSRADAVGIAREHVKSAIDALELASQE